MRRAAVAFVVGGMSLCLAAQASAQWVLPPPPPPPPTIYTGDTPAREVSLSVNLWSLDRGGAGGRWTRNFNKWFAWEASLDGGRHNDRQPGYLMAVTNVRCLLRGPDTAGVFVMAGVGGGSGMEYLVSPVLGIGIQGGW